MAGQLYIFAEFYRADARYAEAESLHRRALAIREESTEITPSALATARNNFAVFLRDKGSYREAVELMEKTVESGAASKTGAATQWGNLGELYALQGWYAKASPLLLKSVDSGEGTDLSILARLRKLARLDYDRKQYSQALPEFQQALTMAIKQDSTAARAGILEDLANLKRDTRQFPDADKLYNEAKALLEEDPVETPFLAHLLDNMGVSAVRQRRFADAEKLLLQARRIYEQTIGTDSALTAGCLADLAVCYREQKRFADAEPLFKRSLETQEKTIGADAPILAIVLKDYSQLLRASNRIGEAGRLEARAGKLEASSEDRGAAGRQ
jgi:tetratricopeptide (TPR) repeat protein